MAFLAFDAVVFLLWAFVSAFLPGIILSLALFRKERDLNFVEKVFIGFSLGLILLPLIPFLLYFLFAIKFNYSIALLSTGIFYLIAFAFCIKNKLQEDVLAWLSNMNIKLTEMFKEEVKISKEQLVAYVLVGLLIVNYLIRLSSYSPIFQELDPYYYTYPAQQLLTLGEMPLDDKTAWYPEVKVSHREIPQVSYLQAIWYSFYTGGGDYNYLLLAVIASMYPPLAAVVAVFSIYLLVGTATKKREWGLIAAGIVSFVPIFILKLAAGEQESQPYAFLSLTFLYAMYALSINKKDHKFSILAGFAFIALALGSSSLILGITAISVYVLLQSILLFLREKDEKELQFHTISTAIVFVIGPLLAGNIIVPLYRGVQLGFGSAVIMFAALVFSALLYLIKQKVPDRATGLRFLGGVILLGIFAFAFTSVGHLIKEMGKNFFEITVFTTPLSRTIAEQKETSADLGHQLGFFASSYETISSTIFMPIRGLAPQAIDSLITGLSTGLAFTFLIFSMLTNSIFSIFVSMFNFLLGSQVPYSPKINGMFLFWVFATFVTFIYSLYLFVKKREDNLFLLIFAILIFPLLVGTIKEKYTIYTGVFLAVAAGFSLGIGETLADRIKKEETKKTIKNILLGIGIAIVFFQFIHQGFAISLLWGSVQPLYQNNPQALAEKFKSFCASTQDQSICEIARDPIAYANKGINAQYDSRLCLLSIYSSATYLGNQGAAPFWEIQAAVFRCQRLSSYWVDSMEWIRTNTEPDARVISWWDYGHWINFFGQRGAVIRNEHVSHQMIGAVADAYLDATPEELKKYMKAHDTKYALFDIELVGDGRLLGGKYGALNYLSCAWNNRTSVAKETTQSRCEAEQLWETIYISSTACRISQISNKTGFLAYKIYENIYEEGPDKKPRLVDTVYRPYYRSDCINPSNPQVVNYCKIAIKPVPAYCVGEVMFSNSQKDFAAYLLNETYPNGDLKLNKARLELRIPIQGTLHFGDVYASTLFYTDDQIWLENGEVKSGYDDRKGKFYSSNLYRGVFLNKIPGFKLVYRTPDDAVKIYKIEE